MQAFENHTHWTAVKDVCRRLREAGHQALLAGGCVRDLLMNREPNDFDVATDATPDEVETLFPKALTVGKAFGVTILPFGEFQVEVATFRQDGAYLDGRRPESVRFSSAEEDAKRRDFTVNALFYDVEALKVIDYVDGEEDIRRRLIRTVGDPHLRFDEDKLRLFRAVRFAAQLDFEIVPETLRAVREMAPEIRIVSRERVRDELLKLLQVPMRVKGLELLLGTGLLEALFPDAAPSIRRDTDGWLKPFRALGPEEKDPVVLLALFFLPRYLELASPVGGPEAERTVRDSALKGLRLENRMIDSILFCYRHMNSYLAPDRVRRGELALLLSHVASPQAEKLVSVLETSRDREAYLQELRAKSLPQDGGRPAPFLSGEDVKAAGIPAGPRMGKLLHEALLLQLEGVLTDHASALEWLKQQA